MLSETSSDLDPSRGHMTIPPVNVPEQKIHRKILQLSASSPLAQLVPRAPRPSPHPPGPTKARSEKRKFHGFLPRVSSDPSHRRKFLRPLSDRAVRRYRGSSLASAESRRRGGGIARLPIANVAAAESGDCTAAGYRLGLWADRSFVPRCGWALTCEHSLFDVVTDWRCGRVWTVNLELLLLWCVSRCFGFGPGSQLVLVCFCNPRM